MAEDIFYLDATELAARIKAGQLTSVQVVQAYLDRIAAVDPKINAIVTLNDDALAEAAAADAALAAGEEVGPLHGVPFTVKDSIDTDGILTQRGSPIFTGRTPDEDAVAVARMKAAGGIVLAKTNLPEFSYSTESVNLLSGRTNNPYNLDRTSGGSSGGESAAIAAGLSPIGLGTDLAISVRGPASHTGIAAIKPTHGRIPMTGVWPRVPRRDWHVGPMARTVRDLELGYRIMRGPDGQDGFAVTPNTVDTGKPDAAPSDLRVAWFTDSGLGPVDPQVADTVRQAAEALTAAGVLVEEIDIPTLHHDNPLALFNKQHVMELKPAMAEATKGHEDLRFTMSKTMLATPDTSVEDYVAAEQGFERIRDAYAEVFTRFDAVLLPVLPIPAHEHDKTEFVIDGQTVDATHIQTFTVQFNITGMPALSMRFGTSTDGLPIGVQIAGPWHAESTVFNVAALLESVSPVRDQHPEI
ncbi:aspartyl-tRNA(Asn)/glutamyl-tRNA(Gln) amidotransferase subunit A [Curtobacterium sp. 320]|uniref:amidase n=1 Tax=Curtobacterium sp. 320 TaxID=2817749 RepID=UPI002864BF20|nr:amidase [Curtobacterium sp. 320]MDR6573235.1 aspartyl-tRNA(Asn)/glutamyl-tRNA(Gln) amidotransferase subunit A [Curtobacterium sp. 320]